jgi:hypothetical protein
MAKTIEEANKVLVLRAFDTLFNKRDQQDCGAILVVQLQDGRRL